MTSATASRTDHFENALTAVREQIGIVERRRPPTTAGGDFAASKARLLTRLHASEARLVAQIEDAKGGR